MNHESVRHPAVSIHAEHYPNGRNYVVMGAQARLQSEPRRISKFRFNDIKQRV
jgi:hypothetical protein